MSRTEPSSDLGARAARGVLWTGGGQILRQLIQVGSQLLLVRMLVPDDFGLLGMAMFFVGLGQMLADFGIGSAIVQSRSDKSVVLSSCFWLNLGVAAGLAVVVLACAPLIGRFYQRADLVPVVAVLSLNLLLAGLQVLPSALLYRDMRFADLARIQVLSTLAGAVAAITLAWNGAGVWALVVQPLFGTTVNLLLSWRAARWLPRFEYSWHQVAPLARFSAALLGTNLVGYANRNVDGLLIGRFLGAGPLGIYSMAIQLMLYPLQQVSSVIVRVLFPTLVQIKDDLPRVRAAYLKAVSTIALVTFPIMGGLFALADDFVLVVFGPAWADMTSILKILSWVGMMQSIGTTMGVIYLATARTDIALRVTSVATLVVVVAIATGLRWGVLGVAISYAVASFSLFYYTAITAFRLIKLELRAFHTALSRPALATFAMIAVLVVLVTMLGSVSPALRLSAGILGGVASYMFGSLLFNRTQIADVLRILRSLYSHRSA